MPAATVASLILRSKIHGSDGPHWTNLVSTTGKDRLFGFVCGNGRFVGVGSGFSDNGGFILAASTPLDFDLASSIRPTTNALLAVAHAKDLFVAVGERGTIVASPDGAHWTVRDSGTQEALRAVVFHRSRFIAGGTPGVVLASGDFLSWSTAAPVPFDVHGLASSPEELVAVGSYGSAGRLHVSPDGLSWPGTSLEFPQPLHAVVHGPGSFVAVGDGGLIVQSDNLANYWTKPTSGYWEEPYWSLGEWPLLQHSAIVMMNPGWKALAVGATTTANYSNALAIQSLLVSAPEGSFNELLLNYAGLDVPLNVASELALGPNASLTSHYSRLIAGRLFLNSPAVFSSQSVVTAGTIVVGDADSGELSIADASVRAGAVTVGGGAPGVVNQSGGTHQVDAKLSINGQSVYNLTNGYLEASTLFLGEENRPGWVAVLCARGGSTTVTGSVRLGTSPLFASNARGQFLLLGGSLQTPVMDFGNGIFTQTKERTGSKALTFRGRMLLAGPITSWVVGLWSQNSWCLGPTRSDTLSNPGASTQIPRASPSTSAHSRALPFGGLPVIVDPKEVCCGFICRNGAKVYSLWGGCLPHTRLHPEHYPHETVHAPTPELGATSLLCMKRLMLFIEPSAGQLNIFSQFTLPRLGSFILAGLVNRRRAWKARVFVEGRHRFDLQSWLDKYGCPEVVGISTITATVQRGYALAAECRARGIPVVLGGPHVTFLPEEALGHAPLVVRGEGEAGMNALLDLWQEGYVEGTDARYAAVPNLSWKNANGVIQQNPVAPWVTDLDALPVPDFSLADGTADCVIGGQKTVMVQTSRGCPFDCSFCSVTGMFGRKFRYRSVESIIEELRRYDCADHFVFFCDDNFTASKQRARTLLEAMLRVRFRFQWSTQVRTDLARDPELVKLMKRAGCHTVFIGFESVNPQSLAEMKKGQSLEDIRKAIRVVQATGIHIHGMFVFGFDGEDWNTVEATVSFARQMKLTSVQLLILTPLPGSDLYRRLRAEGRITSFDWDRYDTHHVVYRPAGYSSFELQCAQVYGHSRLYALSENLLKLATGKWVAAGLSFYASKINRDWQKANQAYLRELAARPAFPDGVDAGVVHAELGPESSWIDASRRPACSF